MALYKPRWVTDNGPPPVSLVQPLRLGQQPTQPAGLANVKKVDSHVSIFDTLTMQAPRRLLTY